MWRKEQCHKPLMSGFIDWIGLLGKWPSEGFRMDLRKFQMDLGKSDGPWDSRMGPSDGPLVVPICVRYTTIFPLYESSSAVRSWSRWYIYA